MRFAIRAFSRLFLTLMTMIPVTLFYFNAAPSIDVHAWSSTLFDRIAGRQGTDAEIESMNTLISNNRLSEALEVATKNDDFINITAKAFCSVMSTRAETTEVSFNDFTATCMGIIRDDRPATEFLTGNYLYRFDYSKFPKPPMDGSAPYAPPTPLDPYKYRMSYSVVEGTDADNNNYAKALMYNGKQQIVINPEVGKPTEIQELPDPAGLLTSFTFMDEHANQGTNRRVVEYAFREFLCTPISAMADTSAPDNWVGMDVDRRPGGNPATFANNCLGCHSQMDPLRGAFAYFSFALNGIYYTQAPFVDSNVIPKKVGPNPKYNERNQGVFPQGHRTVDNSFANYSNLGSANAARFGWRGDLTGKGAREFGVMLSKSKAFSNCMVRRVIQSVCLRDQTFDDLDPWIYPEAANFEADNYNLRRLFGRIAADSRCIDPAQVN